MPFAFERKHLGIIANIAMALTALALPDATRAFGDIMYSKEANLQSYRFLGILCFALFIFDLPVLAVRTKMVLYGVSGAGSSKFIFVLAFFRIMLLINLYMFAITILFGDPVKGPRWATAVLAINSTFSFIGTLYVAACHSSLDDTPAPRAAVSILVMGYEYIYTYVFCQVCDMYTVESFHDRFPGGDQISIFSLKKGENDRAIEQIAACPDPDNKHCACPSLEVLYYVWP